MCSKGKSTVESMTKHQTGSEVTTRLSVDGEYCTGWMSKRVKIKILWNSREMLKRANMA